MLARVSSFFPSQFFIDASVHGRRGSVNTFSGFGGLEETEAQSPLAEERQEFSEQDTNWARGFESVRAFYLSAPFCEMGQKVDFVCLVATMPGRHSGDHVHKVKNTAAPFFYIFENWLQVVLAVVCCRLLLGFYRTLLRCLQGRDDRFYRTLPRDQRRRGVDRG